MAYCAKFLLRFPLNLKSESLLLRVRHRKCLVMHVYKFVLGCPLHPLENVSKVAHAFRLDLYAKYHSRPTSLRLFAMYIEQYICVYSKFDYILPEEPSSNQAFFCNTVYQKLPSSSCV